MILVGAGLLRLIRLRRSLLAAGLIAGTVLGPTVAGRLWPTMFERTITGGVEQRQVLLDLEADYTAGLQGLRAADVSPVAIDEFTAEYERVRTAAEASLDRAVKNHAIPRIMLSVWAPMLAIGLRMPVGRGNRSRRLWHDASFVAAWMSVTVTGTVTLIAAYGLSAPLMPGILVGATYAVAGGLPRAGTTRNGDVTWDETGAGALIQRTGTACWCICLAISAWCVVRLFLDGRESAEAIVSAWILVSAAVGLVLGVMTSRLASKRIICVSSFAAALAVALSLATIDLLYSGVWGPILLAVVISGDARWLGASTGVRLLGHSWRDSWEGTIDIADAASLQAAIAVLAHASQMLSDHLLLAAVFGAVMCDVTHPLRRMLMAPAHTELVDDVPHDETEDPERDDLRELHADERGR